MPKPDTTCLGFFNLGEILGTSVSEPSQAVYMEKLLEMAWECPKVGINQNSPSGVSPYLVLFPLHHVENSLTLLTI